MSDPRYVPARRERFGRLVEVEREQRVAPAKLPRHWARRVLPPTDPAAQAEHRDAAARDWL